MKSIFGFGSYKDYMEYKLTGEGRRGQLTRAADFLNCQRSYLSRVITEKLHITPDNAFNLTRFWKLNTGERKYFLLLVEHDRAVDNNYKVHIKSQMDDLKKKNDSIQERTQRSSFSIDNLQAQYFSSWIYSALHFLTTIPAYQNLDMMSARLGLKKETLLIYLKQLEAQGLIYNKSNQWIFQAGEFHIPKNSPLVVFHHQNWRARAIQDSQDFESSHVHFTGILTLSLEDYEKLKELILDFIAQANEIATPSEAEEAVALTCDLFRI